MRTLNRSLVIWAGLLMVALPTLAQVPAGSVEIAPTVGYWFGDTLTRGTTGAFNYDVTIDDAASYGLRFAYHFNEHWALEALLARERADLVTGKKELFGGQKVLGNIDLTTSEIGFEGSFGHSRLVPFIAGGVGAMRLAPNVAGTTADTRFVANFGGGLKLFFTPTVALRFDFRGHSVNIRGNHGDCHWWNDCTDNFDWLTFREVALGLTFVL
jgi:hypothetical protein